MTTEDLTQQLREATDAAKRARQDLDVQREIYRRACELSSYLDQYVRKLRDELNERRGRAACGEPEPVCRNCNEAGMRHQDEHDGLCCDCFDLSCGQQLELINEERAQRGAVALKAWVETT